MTFFIADRLAHEYQQHGSAVATGSSPVVQYGYANGSSNTIRMTSLTYPDGRVLDYDHGSAGSQTDRLDRVASVDDGAQTLVEYDYTGGGQVVTQTYQEPGIERTLALGSGSNPYSALDRFGRMIDLRWSKGASDLVSFEYDYDRSSNRLFDRNLVDGSGGSNPAVDGLFEFDELNRLVEFKSGQLNGGGTAIASPTKTQDWTLDETGNWKQFTPGVSDAVVQSRTHNSVNEITNITETSGAAWATPAHDDAGNMTSIPQPSDLTDSYDATWDAWNRLVKLSDSSVTVVTYDYDGSNRRIIKTLYSSGSPSEPRHVLYSAGSQVLEERLGSSADADEQFVWNLGYVDDLVLRDRDTNSNGTLDERLYSLPDLRYCVMALANTSGTILERYAYDAYGRSSAMTNLFASRSSSSYEWEFRYTGRREDLESGLLFFRARYYSVELGRFTGRDPLGFVDGMSLYRGYMVPNGVDPFGLILLDKYNVYQGDEDIRKAENRGCTWVVNAVGQIVLICLTRGRCKNKPRFKPRPRKPGPRKPTNKPRKPKDKDGHWYCNPKVEVFQLTPWTDEDTGDSGEIQKRMSCILVGLPSRNHKRHCVYRCPDGTSRFADPTWVPLPLPGK